MTILYNFNEAIACICYFIFSILTLELAFPHHNRYRFSYILLAGILYFPLTYPPLAILPNIAGSLLSVGIVLLLSFAIYEGKWGHKLLIVLSYNLVDILLANLYFRLASRTSGLDFSALSLPGNVARLYIILLVYLSELLILCLLRTKLHRISKKLTNDYPIILLFLLCSFFVVLINYYIQFYFSYGDEVLEALGLFSTIMMLIIIFSALALFIRLQKRNKQLQEAQITKWKTEQQKELLRSIEESEKKVREIRHDMKSYFLAYHTLLKEGKTQEVLQDLQKMLETRLNKEEGHFSENPLLDSMLAYKQQICIKKQIRFVPRISIPPRYDDIEMIVVLSNIIDNAIEAQESISAEKRFVSVEIIPRPHALSILVENPILQSVLAQNPDLMTTKEDFKSHGLGIGSVKRIVAQRNGVVDIGEKNNLFFVHIYLPRIN